MISRLPFEFQNGVEKAGSHTGGLSLVVSFWKGLVEWSAGLAVVRSPHGAEPECAIVLMAFKTPTAQPLLSAQICGRAILIPVVHIYDR